MFKDGSWWVCSFFIGLFCYMLGAVGGDIALSHIASFAGIVAGCATAFAAFFAYKSFSTWEERTKKQHFLENKTAAIKELSLCYEMHISELSVCLDELYHFQKHKSNNRVHDDEYIKREDDTKRKRQKVNESWARYKSSFIFTQSFYTETILNGYQPNDLITLQKSVCEIAKDGGSWDGELRIFENEGTKKILALYDNQD
ncbi:hypothetical protein GV054_09060 [Marinomonas mediterranea]|uniref:hypothetical protein n=1 Tax=Marinomonas mediterranea TaxID=119864 RepID=UPI0023496824|nr:hypothetical protein [Marinomonas mediterranea]WCN13144.1 hypothetical protein GV054_09060 [Marinomonas mediterranea]